MKIGIIGSGAMGSIYGGILAEEGNEVYLIDVFAEHVNEINENGLCLVTDGEERYIKSVKATTDPHEVGKVDLAIIFVKSTITDIAVEQNSSVFGDKTIVLTLQNGIGNIEKISKFVDEKQIIAGTSSNGGNMIGPGKINHAGNGGTTIGELDGSDSQRIKMLGELLDTEGLGKCEVSHNVMGLIWDKLLVNVGVNPITALTGLRNGQLLENPESISLMEELVGEGVKVAKELGIQLKYEDTENAKYVCKSTADNKSSMLMDVLNQRKTEIANINGAIVKEGRKLNISTPVNELVTNLITLKEKSY